jgi:hypothetical protein
MCNIWESSRIVWRRSDSLMSYLGRSMGLALSCAAVRVAVARGAIGPPESCHRLLFVVTIRTRAMFPCGDEENSYPLKWRRHQNLHCSTTGVFRVSRSQKEAPLRPGLPKYWHEASF